MSKVVAGRSCLTGEPAAEDLMRDYLGEEMRKGANRDTLKTYTHQLRRFNRFLEAEHLEFRILTYRDAREYKLFLRRWQTPKGSLLSSSSIQGYLVRADRFCEFLKSSGLVMINPFLGVKSVKKETVLPRRPISEMKMDSLLTFLSIWWEDDTGFSVQVGRYLAHVIAEIMYSTGLRAFETATLTADDIDLVRGEIVLRKGKGEKSRLVFISSYACEVLQIYLDEIRPLILRGHTKKSKTLFGVGPDQFKFRLNARLKEASGILGIPKQTSHSFRHAFGSHLLRGGCDIRKIQALLGHRSIETTQIYTKLEKEDLRSVLNTYHPHQLQRVTNGS